MKNNIVWLQNRNHPSLETDLLQLTALVRERQSSLLVLLEEKRQKVWERPEWLLKECQYQQKDNSFSREIRRIVMNWVLFNQEEPSAEETYKAIRNFWLKIKIVIKMSLQKMKSLGLLNLTLFERYEGIIDEINCGYDRVIGITHYRTIEDLIKKRNRQIHQLLNQRIQLPPIERNHSDYQLNLIRKEQTGQMRSSKLLSLTKRKHILTGEKLVRRPFSQQGRQKRPLYSRQLQKGKQIKNVKKNLDLYQQKLYDIMEMRVDMNTDKIKKGKNCLETAFNDLMDRNAGNQKEITKFILKHSGRMIRKINAKRTLKVAHKQKNIELPPTHDKTAKLKNAERNKRLIIHKFKKKDKTTKKALLRLPSSQKQYKKCL